jgi:tRNA (Thr-GGU) A37 N-methylase
VGSDPIEIRPVARVESPLRDPAADVLKVHPRDDASDPLRGVFATRSQDRPNPLGLHPVEIVAIEGARVRVRNLEAVDGTPVVDVKPLLRRAGGA